MNSMEALREALKMSPLNRQAIADKAGYNNTTINKWLRGVTSPKTMDINAVINATGFVMNITLELPMGKTFWNPLEKKAAIYLYTKEFRTIGEIATKFNCSREHVERMLKAEGQLL